MLHACKDSGAVGQILSLIALDHGSRHLCSQIRVLSRSFRHTSPARIRRDIAHRRECPCNTHCSSFGSRYTCRFPDSIRIPCTCTGKIDREKYLAAMNDVMSEKNWNAKSRTVNSHTLHPFNLFRSLNIEYRAHLASLYQLLDIHFFSSRARNSTCAGHKLAHLSKLFTQSHLLHQIIDKSVGLSLWCTSECSKNGQSGNKQSFHIFSLYKYYLNGSSTTG